MYITWLSENNFIAIHTMSLCTPSRILFTSTLLHIKIYFYLTLQGIFMNTLLPIPGPCVVLGHFMIRKVKEDKYLPGLNYTNWLIIYLHVQWKQEYYGCREISVILGAFGYPCKMYDGYVWVLLNTWSCNVDTWQQPKISKQGRY